ncbi:putative metal-binding motif-containing protein, partial [Myxococcota bacterium]|nr:putative metal-binding motif-containing protein [Myxococcota bacterium]
VLINTTYYNTPPTPPFGGGYNYDYDYYNYVEVDDHPALQGIGGDAYGSPASYSYGTGLPLDADILMTNESELPAIWEVKRGLGTVIVTHQWAEYSGYYGYTDFRTLIYNELAYLDDWAGCVAEAESCDFHDNDCDGAIDEGLDTDGDGFTPCQGDCDDGAATVHPDGVEVCNGVDDDC